MRCRKSSVIYIWAWQWEKASPASLLKYPLFNCVPRSGRSTLAWSSCNKHTFVTIISKSRNHDPIASWYWDAHDIWHLNLNTTILTSLMEVKGTFVLTGLNWLTTSFSISLQSCSAVIENIQRLIAVRRLSSLYVCSQNTDAPINIFG